MKLAQLLGTNHPNFSRSMYELEQAAGNPGIDTKLLGDITEQAHAVLRQLRLDSNDTHARELYQALLSAVKADNQEVFANTDYVLMVLEDELISFNLQDVVEASHHELAFEERSVGHAQRHLRMEIVRRYAEHDRTHDEIVRSIAANADVHRDDDAQYPVMTSNKEESTMNQDAPSILMIGDIFTDAFIKLNEDYAVVEKDEDGKEWLKLPFGSKPPYEHADIVRSVGPSPNSAISCARLGLRASLMAWLGDDQYGKESLAHLQGENVGTASMVTEDGTPSSYWFVLRHGTDRTMLVKSEAYHYEWRDPVEKPDWLYLAYIGENSVKFHEQLADYLDTHQDIRFVFQPATYHFEWGVEKLAKLYDRANILVLNREEAMQITGKPHDDLHVLAQALHGLGPEIVAITDGAHGSYVSDGNKLITIPNYPDPAPPVDRTGAGDAFASTLVAALALGEDIETALRWAPINSASVVQKVGAQAGLLHRDELEQWLKEAPDDYQVSSL